MKIKKRKPMKKENKQKIFETIIEATLLIEIAFIIFVIYVVGPLSTASPILLGLFAIQVWILPTDNKKEKP